MKTKLIALFSILFIFGIFISSCDESLLPNPEETNTQSAEDNATAELGVATVFENVNNYGISEEGIKSLFLDDAGPVVTWDSLHRTVTMDFTDVSNSSGTIAATFTGEPSATTAGLTAAVTISNFLNEGTVINGAFTLTLSQIIDLVNETGPVFDIVITNDLTFTADSVTTTWTGNRHIVFAEGFLTPRDQSDDVFLISGSSAGVNADGVAYTVVISSENPLRFDNCEWISKGEITITEGEGDSVTVMSIDFGDGTCDNEMFVTVNGITVTLQM